MAGVYSKILVCFGVLFSRLRGTWAAFRSTPSHLFYRLGTVQVRLGPLARGTPYPIVVRDGLREFFLLRVKSIVHIRLTFGDLAMQYAICTDIIDS